MARAGTVEALDSDYARTAVLKGLPRRTVIRRHVLRNSLLPTITVIATQTGYLIGGLFVVETLFHYNGVGSLIYNAATQQGLPDARGRSARDRRSSTCSRRWSPTCSTRYLNPRIRLPGRRMSIDAVPVESAGAVAAVRTAPSRAASSSERSSAPRRSSWARSSSGSGSSARSSGTRSPPTIRPPRTSARSTGRRRARTGSVPISSGATCSRG